MQCVKCHAELKPESRFCGKCGSDVASAIMERNIQTLQNDGYREEPGVPCPSCQRSMVFVKTETRQGVEGRVNFQPPVPKGLVEALIEIVFLFLIGIVREAFFPPKKLILKTDFFTCSFCVHEWKGKERVVKLR